MFDLKRLSIDSLCIVACIACYAAAFVWTSAVRPVSFAAGGVAAMYCGYYLYVWLFRPIKRDQILVRGKFLRKVICFVLLVPFLLAAVFYMSGLQSSVLMSEAPASADAAGSGEGESLLWCIYCHFVDPGNQHMASAAGRGWTVLISISGILLLNGLLVSTLVNWFDKRRESWLNGNVRYTLSQLGKYNFALVIGANENAPSVIKNLLSSETSGVSSTSGASGGSGSPGIRRGRGKVGYVILHTSSGVREVRELLSSALPEKMRRRVIIYSGHRNSPLEIKGLRPAYAVEIHVLGESTLVNGEEHYHDAMNMKCVNLLASCIEEEKTKTSCKEAEKKASWFRRIFSRPRELPPCRVMFEYQTTYSVFQFSDISSLVRNNLKFIPANRFDSWARRVIADGFSYAEDGSRITYSPLDGHGISAESDDYVHFIIVGMSKMGVAMGVQALLQAHYPNYARRRSRITFIDSEADREMAFFRGRYANLFELVRNRYANAGQLLADAGQCLPDVWKDDSFGWTDPMSRGGKWAHLSSDGKNFLDVEIEFIKGELESDGIRAYLSHAASDTHARITIAICLTQTHQAVAASLYMPVDVYMSSSLQEVWVYQRESSDIIANLVNTDQKDRRYKKLRPFGMLFGEYMPDRKNYFRAMLTNTAYDMANGYDGYSWPKSLDDRDAEYKKACESWSGLVADKKWSNRFFADAFWLKIRSVMSGKAGFVTETEVLDSMRTHPQETVSAIDAAIRDNDLLARTEHNRWNVQQLVLGYYPCDKSLFDEFKALHEAADRPEARAAEKAWEAEVGWNDRTPAERELLMSRPDFRALDKGRFLWRKREVKESEFRVHPNLCDYDLLDLVDSGAKDYDMVLNNAIPKILEIVDGTK